MKKVPRETIAIGIIGIIILSLLIFAALFPKPTPTECHELLKSDHITYMDRSYVCR